MRYVIAITMLCLGLLLQPGLAHAQDLAKETAEFFQSNLPVEDRLRRPRTPLQIQAIEMRHALDNIIHLGDVSALSELKAEVDTSFEVEFPGLFALGNIFESALQEGGLNREKLENALVEFDAQDDWYAAVYANIALSILHLRQMELLLAGQYTQDALDRIPQELSPLVSDAQLIIAEQMIMLYGISANPERMLEASKTTRRLNAELGSHFDRHELMTNFLLAFNRSRDHAGAQQIAELIKQEESATDTHSELARVYKADLYNEIGDFETALDIAMKAESASDPFIQRRAIGEQMIAYAGLGRRTDAIAKMKSLGFWGVAQPSEKAFNSEGALHALALLAASEGDSAQAVAFMNQRLDLMIGKLRAANANDTSSLLSHLENSRERQQEREAALQREAEMRAVQLRQQQRLNRMLMIVIALIMSALITAIFFFRYREKNNARVAVLREQALSAEKMKTEFLGVVNHELRTPLNGVIGISDALIHHSPDPQTRAQAETILECGEKLQDLVESMIDMSTIEGGKLTLMPEPVVLTDMLEAEAAHWAKPATQKGLTFTHFLGEGLEQSVEVDVARFRQCVRILLSNATRFTHQGRIHLHVTTQATEAGQLQITAIVADTGQGISDTVQERLFKPFLQADSTMTRKYGGAGLSLAIARKLAEMMGGTVTVVSAEGRGSEFTFTATLPLVESMAEGEIDDDAIAPITPFTDLQATCATEEADEADKERATDHNPADNRITDAPLAAPIHELNADDTLTDALDNDRLHADIIDLLDRAPTLFEGANHEATSPTPSFDPNDLTGVRVLVVEDMPSNQDVIRLMLEPEGCVCIPALSGQEGLDLLARQTVDVVVMDIRMPGMDGVEATRAIRGLASPEAALPILVLTAEASAEMNAEAVEAGADLFLTKPVIGRDLIEAIRFVRRDKALQQKRA